MFTSAQPRYRVTRDRRRVAAAALGMILSALYPWAPARAETPPKPAVQLPLASLGFPGHTLSLLHAGASMSTVHMLDSSHVLLTYSLRGLVPRLAGDDDGDSDRQVAALVVEVPSGKVLARTVWHMHDHGRYLWSVGHGVYVVRIGRSLSVMAPLRGLGTGNPFARMALPLAQGVPADVSGSADGAILTVQLVEEEKAEAPEEPGALPPKPRKHVLLQFFRLSTAGVPDGPIQVQMAGSVAAPGLLQLALDGDGYLWAEDQRRGNWQVSFNEYGGKLEKIASILSSCTPRLKLVSRSEFLVSSCRGADDIPVMAAYGFDGHENWEEHFGQTLQAPSFALAPGAGRFAMSRLAPSAGGGPVSGMGQEEALSQEVRVYQTGSGDLLLKVQCLPVARAAENFDLAPDGTALAILGRESLDIYRLPELGARDRKDLAEAEQMQPPLATGAVDLRRISHPVEREGRLAAVGRAPAPTPSAAKPEPAPAETAKESRAAEASVPAPKTEPAKPAAVAQRPAQDSPADAAGDGETAAPRKPPTLLKPGETPSYKTPPTAPQ